MKNPAEYIRESLQAAALALGHTLDLPPQVELPKMKSYGDLSTNLALTLAGRAGGKPREIAERLRKAVSWDSELIEKVEIAGPGFINFTLSRNWFYQGLKGILEAGERFGRSDAGGGKKTQVEFVSANPTGPLTIGHGRQAVLGDTIARLLETAGYDVMREYYFNDAGRQMRVLGDSVRLRYLGLLGEKVDFPEEYYQGEYITDIARMAIEEKGKGAGSEENLPYFQELAKNVIFEDIRKTLERLSIAFDAYYNEKSLYETGRIDEVIRLLREKGMAYEKEGALWFRATAFGHEDDRVIVKSTGEPTYRLPDIAYHKDKIDRGFDLVVDIFGSDHIATYPDVLAGLTALGYPVDRIKVLIHQFVTLSEGKQKIKMSTRKANFVTLDELMDEVGVDVTRYFFLNRSMSSHLNFDLTLAKTVSEENPVYYVQYAHARISSILRHATEKGVDPEGEADLTLLRTEEEMQLIKKLLEYPEIVSLSVREFAPHHLPLYLEEVATVYHRFQHIGKEDGRFRVVTDDEALTRARLALCRAARIVLANGLSILGISKPEKM